MGGLLLKIAFSLRAVDINGQWDNKSKTLTLQDLSGSARLTLGLLCMKGSLGFAGDNLVYFYPRGLVAHLEITILGRLLSRRLGGRLSIRSGRIMLDPNDLLPQASAISFILENKDKKSLYFASAHQSDPL